MTAFPFLGCAVLLFGWIIHYSHASPSPVGAGEGGRTGHPRGDPSRLPARLGIVDLDPTSHDVAHAAGQSAFHRGPDDAKDSWDFRLEDHIPNIVFRDSDGPFRSEGSAGGASDVGASPSMEDDQEQEQAEVEGPGAGLSSSFWPDLAYSEEERGIIVERLSRILEARTKMVIRMLKRAYQHEDGQPLLGDNLLEMRVTARELKKRAAYPRPTAQGMKRGRRRGDGHMTNLASSSSSAMQPDGGPQYRNEQVDKEGAGEGDNDDEEEEEGEGEGEGEGRDLQGPSREESSSRPLPDLPSELPISRAMILQIRRLIKEYLPAKVTGISKAELNRRIDTLIQVPEVAQRILLGDDRFTEEMARHIGPLRYRQYKWQLGLRIPQVEEIYTIVLDSLKQAQIAARVRSVAIRRLGRLLSPETARLVLDRQERTLTAVVNVLTAGIRDPSDEAAGRVDRESDEGPSHREWKPFPPTIRACIDTKSTNFFSGDKRGQAPCLTVIGYECSPKPISLIPDTDTLCWKRRDVSLLGKA